MQSPMIILQFQGNETVKELYNIVIKSIEDAAKMVTSNPELGWDLYEELAHLQAIVHRSVLIQSGAYQKEEVL